VGVRRLSCRSPGGVWGWSQSRRCWGRFEDLRCAGGAEAVRVSGRAWVRTARRSAALSVANPEVHVRGWVEPDPGVTCSWVPVGGKVSMNSLPARVIRIVSGNSGPYSGLNQRFEYGLSLDTGAANATSNL